LFKSDFSGTVNIGSEEMISINDFVHLVAKISAKKVVVKNIDGPTGVRGRCSDNRMIEEKIGWQPKVTLAQGLRTTYSWIAEQVERAQLSR
jgi:nucleoside-diphosphate-sugar epimerase